MLKPIIKLSERMRLLDEKTNRRLRIYNRTSLAILVALLVGLLLFLLLAK